MGKKLVPPILIHCDSTATIGKVNNRHYNGKSKAIRTKHSIVQASIKNGTIIVNCTRSSDNIADPLTKPLAREKV